MQARQDRVTAETIRNSKRAGKKLVMLTAYDYAFAKLLDESDVDMVLVGDSLGMVVMGESDTTTVTLQAMLHHAKAVRRGVSRALLIGDLPFPSIHGAGADLLASSRAFVEQAGCDAVKVEWAEGMPDKVKAVVAAGIAVMGHVGLTPQTAQAEGGFGMRGKDAASAERIYLQAKALADAGCFAMVLECVPDELAALITRKLSVPTVGIGSGPQCDGQVLVSYDLLGLFERFTPRFVERYAKLAESVRDAANRFGADVRQGRFPAEKHTVHLAPDELARLNSRVPA
jgi:3-methyl-2-oxobutanoate hydroxymethyltransferase